MQRAGWGLTVRVSQKFFGNLKLVRHQVRKTVKVRNLARLPHRMDRGNKNNRVIESNHKMLTNYSSKATTYIL